MGTCHNTQKKKKKKQKQDVIVLACIGTLLFAHRHLSPHRVRTWAPELDPRSPLTMFKARVRAPSPDSSSSSSSSSDSSESSTATASLPSKGPKQVERVREVRPPKPSIGPGTLLHSSISGPAAIFPADYPIVRAPIEDMRRLLGYEPPPRRSALDLRLHERRKKRTELGRIRDSFAQMWFICLLTLAAISVPAGLVIAPFIIPASERLSTAQPYTPPSTPYPWTNVSPQCLREVKLNDVIKHLRVRSPSQQLPARQHPGDLICLFNNSRFRKAQSQYDYVPQTMPLPLCNSLLYWSVAFTEGRVHNRVPEFDMHHGVWQLHKLVPLLAQSGSLPKLLVAVGGHAEDSAHFSRFARYGELFAVFAATLMRFSAKHKFGGAVIHWVDMGGACGSPKDVATVAGLLGAINKLRNINEGQYATGVIVPAHLPLADQVTRAAVRYAATFVIYETHLLHQTDVVSMCMSATAESVTLIQVMAAIPPVAPGVVTRLCVSFTAGVPTSRAYSVGAVPTVVPNFVPLASVSQLPWKVAVYEFCSLRSQAAVPPYGQWSAYSNPSSCSGIEKRIVNTTIDETTLPSGVVVPALTEVADYYGFLSAASIQAQYAATSTYPDSRCAAVYDLDFDAEAALLGCTVPNVQLTRIIEIEDGLR